MFIKYIRNIVLSVFLFMTIAIAGTVQVTLVDPGIGVTNGSGVYVGPYDLSIDGKIIKGSCINYNIEIGTGFTWTANYVPFDSYSGIELNQLEEMEWLNLQFNSEPTSYWGLIHQAIWDINGPGTPYTDSGTLEWVTAAQSNYGSINPNFYSVLIPTPNPEISQSFLVVNNGGVPEPGTSFMIGGGLFILGRMFRRNKLKDQ